MMRSEIREERVKKYGSFLFCPERRTLYFGINTPDGICGVETCYLDDPVYIAKQLQIKERRKQNAERMRRESLLEEQDPPAKIRNQSKYPLLSKAKKLEEKAAKYYRENNPRKADALLAEAIRLRGEEKARRRKNEKQEPAKQ